MKYAFAGTAFAAAMAVATATTANEYSDQIQTFANQQLSTWLSESAIISAIAAQNNANTGITSAQINDLDQQWRGGVDAGDSAFIDQVLSHPASGRLREIKDESEGLITEIFLMDSHGLNVAQSDVTSDYWQGDEAKFNETYGQGAGAIHIGDVEFDESSQTYQSQVSMSISDPATGTLIGAVTVGIDVEMLE